jgi:hypothetical protein
MAFPNQIQGMNRMMYVEGNPVGYRDPSGNNAGKGLMEMFASLISQPISNELLVYATFATGKGGRGAKDLALVNLTSQFLAGNFGQEFFDQPSNVQSNIAYALAIAHTGARISDAFKRIFRSIDHSLKKIARAGYHVSKSIAKYVNNHFKEEARRNDKAFRRASKGIAGTARRIAKGMDGGARWLISGGKFSRSKGNDIDYTFGSIGIDTNGFFDSFVRSDLGGGITDINQSGCLTIVATILTAGLSEYIVTDIASISPELGVLLGIGGRASLINNSRKCISILGSVDRDVGGR